MTYFGEQIAVTPPHLLQHLLIGIILEFTLGSQ